MKVKLRRETQFYTDGSEWEIDLHSANEHIVGVHAIRDGEGYDCGTIIVLAEYVPHLIEEIKK